MPTPSRRRADCRASPAVPQTATSAFRSGSNGQPPQRSHLVHDRFRDPQTPPPPSLDSLQIPFAALMKIKVTSPGIALLMIWKALYPSRRPFAAHPINDVNI